MKTLAQKPIGLLLAVVMLVSSIPVIALSANGAFGGATLPILLCPLT